MRSLYILMHSNTREVYTDSSCNPKREYCTRRCNLSRCGHDSNFVVFEHFSFRGISIRTCQSSEIPDTYGAMFHNYFRTIVRVTWRKNFMIILQSGSHLETFCWLERDVYSHFWVYRPLLYQLSRRGNRRQYELLWLIVSTRKTLTTT